MNQEEQQNSTKEIHENAFLVNKGSIPLDKETWNTMLNKINTTHPEGDKILHNLREREKEYLNMIRNSKIEGQIDKSYSPPLFELKIYNTMSALQKLGGIQKYLNQLQYNHTGMQFFCIKKTRSITRLYETAKEMIKYSLPIKCLEAVVLALYLTASIKNISRFTIRFKTKSGGNIHKHIVLGIHHNSKYGALGLSRRKTLMDKPFTYKTLTDLILDYKKCYEDCFHVLEKVKMSPPLPTDIHSCDQISWNHYSLSIGKLSEPEIRHALEKYSREMRKKSDCIL